MASTDLLSIFHDAVGILEAEGHEAEVRPEYSGRGMYGHSAPAIVTSAPAVHVGAAVYAAAIAARSEEDWAWDAVPDRSDSMGKSYIYY